MALAREGGNSLAPSARAVVSDLNWLNIFVPPRSVAIGPGGYSPHTVQAELRRKPLRLCGGGAVGLGAAELMGQAKAAAQMFFYFLRAGLGKLMADAFSGHLAGKLMQVQSQSKSLLAAHRPIAFDLPLKRFLRIHRNKSPGAVQENIYGTSE